MNSRELQKHKMPGYMKFSAEYLRPLSRAIRNWREYNGFRGSICVTGLELIQGSPGGRGYMRQTGNRITPDLHLQEAELGDLPSLPFMQSW
ncbi:hypothetical protein [Planomicrobium soli]|uniref:hypothetical protein n=1 Tax=Planomicrobium soli TaxID=1176648 RepID=UPI000D0DB418|nr:hypothetical protein [Planomicrobium soli]